MMGAYKADGASGATGYRKTSVAGCALGKRRGGPAWSVSVREGEPGHAS
jgi:hypothetical protein